MEFATMMTPGAPGATPAPAVAARGGGDSTTATGFDQVLASQVAGPTQDVGQQAEAAPAVDTPAQPSDGDADVEPALRADTPDPAATAQVADVVANSAAAAALAAWMLAPVAPSAPPPTPVGQPAEAGTDADALAAPRLSETAHSPSAPSGPALVLPAQQQTDAVQVATGPGIETSPEARTPVASAAALPSPSAMFQGLMPQLVTSAAPAPMAQALPVPDPPQLAQTVGSHGWAEELGTRLALQSVRGEHSGSLRLSPEHLGPLEVQIRLQDDKASVVFGAQHAETRAALHEALPRLRELFAASGLQLLDASVTRDGSRQQALPPRVARGLGVAAVEDSPPEVRRVTVGLRHLGLVDTIA